MIRQGLDVSDVISTNDHIYAKEIDVLTLVPLYANILYIKEYHDKDTRRNLYSR